MRLFKWFAAKTWLFSANIFKQLAEKLVLWVQRNYSNKALQLLSLQTLLAQNSPTFIFLSERQLKA